MRSMLSYASGAAKVGEQLIIFMQHHSPLVSLYNFFVWSGFALIYFGLIFQQHPMDTLGNITHLSLRTVMMTAMMRI